MIDQLSPHVQYHPLRCRHPSFPLRQFDVWISQRRVVEPNPLPLPHDNGIRVLPPWTAYTSTIVFGVMDALVSKLDETSFIRHSILMGVGEATRSLYRRLVLGHSRYATFLSCHDLAYHKKRLGRSS